MGMIAPPSGIRDRGSLSPSLPLSCRLIANSASHPPPCSPLSLPTPVAQQLLAEQLPAAGAGEVVGGEGGDAQLASRAWPALGSRSPVRPGAERSSAYRRGLRLRTGGLGPGAAAPPLWSSPLGAQGAVSIADCRLPSPRPRPRPLACGLTQPLRLFSTLVEPCCRASGWDSRPPRGRCRQRGTARGARGGRGMREPATPGGC